MMAAINRAKIIAQPAPPPTCRINSTGSKVTTVNATAPLEGQHAEEIADSGPDHCCERRHAVGIDHCRDRVGGIVKGIDELKPQRDHQSDSEQHEGADCQILSADTADITGYVEGGITEACGEYQQKRDRSGDMRLLVQMRTGGVYVLYAAMKRGFRQNAPVD